MKKFSFFGGVDEPRIAREGVYGYSTNYVDPVGNCIDCQMEQYGFAGTISVHNKFDEKDVIGFILGNEYIDASHLNLKYNYRSQGNVNVITYCVMCGQHYVNSVDVSKGSLIVGREEDGIVADFARYLTDKYRNSHTMDLKPIPSKELEEFENEESVVVRNGEQALTNFHFKKFLQEYTQE